MLKRLIHEIHRRSLWQVVGIYLVGAWIGYQVILALTDGLGLPDWVPPLAFVLFIIGLPIVTATAFVQEGVPGRDGLGLGPRADALPDGALEPNMFAASDAGSAPAPGDSESLVQRLLTWPRALLGGVLAFALLGAVTTGWVGMRALGIGPVGSLVAAGALERSERILIADFQSPTGQDDLARVVTEAFRIDFSRSTLVRPVDPSAVREVLQRMGRADETLLGPELVHEVALRDGINVYLTGEVGSAGTGWVISTRLVSTSTGETLLGLRETARDSADIVPAIDRLSRHLRERTGESLRTIRRTPPLEQVTTSSLEALRKYTEGRRAQLWGDQAKGLELFEEAVGLDSAFASAWRGIAVVRSNFQEPEDALEAVEKALRHQNRLTEVERHLTVGMDHSIRRQYQRAIAAYERALVIDPYEPTALNNIAVQYGFMDDLVRAEQYYRRSIATDTAILRLTNLASVLVARGNFDEARELYRRAISLEPDAVTPRISLAVLPATYGDYDGAERELRALIDDTATPARILEIAGWQLARILPVRGRLAEAAELMQQRLLAEGDREASEIQAIQNGFWTELQYLDRPDRARATLARLRPLVERYAEADSTRLVRLVWACSALGDVACARDYLARAGLSGPLEAWSPRWHHELHAEVALAEGDIPAALRLFRASATMICRNCFETGVARAHFAAGQPDSAIAAYERFLASPSLRRPDRQDWELPLIHSRLAELYEERGDPNAAAQHHARLIELWQHADPELQPRVEASRRALERLRADTPVGAT